MSAFEAALRQGPPEPDMDMSMYLPAKVGGTDKGGEAAKATPAGGAARPTDSQGSVASGPEPAPQLPEGSDPDEPDAPEESLEDLARLAREMFNAPEPPAAEPLAPEVAVAQEEPPVDPAGQTTEDSTDPEARPLAVPRKGGGLTFEGPSVNLKYFPRVLVEQMRTMLEPHLGEDFARDLSQFSLVTAFVVAAMGSDLVTDEYTREAAKAFRAADPRTDAIDKRTTALLAQQTKADGMLKAILGRLGAVAETASVLEIGQAYALAERTAQLDTSATVPENIDVTQKRALAARDHIRSRAKKQLQDEKIQAGRPIR